MIHIVLSSIFFLSGIIIITWIHNQYKLDIEVKPAPDPSTASLDTANNHRLLDPPLREDLPFISVCIPARNEERNIGRCVEALLAQTYSNFEIIVLDDRSTDSTTEILRYYAAQNGNLKVINGSNLPSGWAGKPHALIQAAAAARGEWLCFVDADTFVTLDALAAVYAKATETKADLFTIMTRQIMLTC